MAKIPAAEAAYKGLIDTIDVTVRSSRNLSKGREARARDYGKALYDAAPDVAPPVPQPEPAPEPKPNELKGSDDHGGKTLIGNTASIDLVTYPRPRAYYTIHGSTAELIVEQTGGGMDTLKGIDLVAFADLTASPAVLLASVPAPDPQPEPPPDPVPNPDPQPIPDPQPQPEPQPQPSGALSVRLSNGVTLTEAAPRSGHWSAQFRRFGARTEVVLNLGTMHTGVAAAANAALASWSVYDGTALLGTKTIPGGRFNWHGRSRWMSAPEPMILTPAQAAAQGRLPLYKVTAGMKITNRPGPATYVEMGFSSIEPVMTKAGGRPDIGLYPAWVAAYLAEQTPANEASMRAIAEAAGSMPCMVFDENTGRPISPAQYPEMAGADTRWGGTPKMGWPDTGWVLDSAHFPDVSYAMAVLTGGLYHRENVQMQAITLLAMRNPGYREGKFIVIPEQVRDYYWTMRMIARAWAVSPEQAEPTLLPRKVFADILEANFARFRAQFMQSTRRQYAVFHDLMDMWNQPDEGGYRTRYVKFWQGCFGVQVTQEMLRLGLSQIRDVADWVLDPLLKRTTLGTGWNRAYPINYYDIVGSKPMTKSTDDFVVTSYAEAWALTKGSDPKYKSTADTIDPNTDANYIAQARCGLALAVANGNAAAAPAFAWLAPQSEALGLDLQLCVAA